jgi:hypothetical protein
VMRVQNQNVAWRNTHFSVGMKRGQKVLATPPKPLTINAEGTDANG